jgi:hypothetical protein
MQPDRHPNGEPGAERRRAAGAGPRARSEGPLTPRRRRLHPVARQFTVRGGDGRVLGSGRQGSRGACGADGTKALGVQADPGRSVHLPVLARRLTMVLVHVDQEARRAAGGGRPRWPGSAGVAQFPELARAADHGPGLRGPGGMSVGRRRPAQVAGQRRSRAIPRVGLGGRPSSWSTWTSRHVGRDAEMAWGQAVARPPAAAVGHPGSGPRGPARGCEPPGLRGPERLTAGVDPRNPVSRGVLRRGKEEKSFGAGDVESRIAHSKLTYRVPVAAKALSLAMTR